MRIAALDDQKQWIQKEQEITEKYCAHKKEELVFKAYTDVTSFLQDLQNRELFDIYLLDVEMPERDGLSVATEIKKKCAEPIIIYITAYPQYAPRGYEVNAYRYILKEQIEEKLPEAYDSLRDKLASRDGKYYMLLKGTEFEQLSQQDVFYIKKDGKYAVFHTDNGKKKERKSLQEVYERLDTEDFVFIDKGLLVNVRHIMKLEADTVKMRDGAHFFISRPRQKIVKQKIMEYWGRRI